MPKYTFKVKTDNNNTVIYITDKLGCSEVVRAFRDFLLAASFHPKSIEKYLPEGLLDEEEL